MVNTQRILSVNKAPPAWKSVSQIRYKALSLKDQILEEILYKYKIIIIDISR